MRSVLNLDRLTEQATLLKPDVALLDFGTNDILYHDSINANLPNEIYQSINKLREVNPDISIIMTSTQDLLRNDRYITAGPKFRDLVDSIARRENVMFWNWYDLSGGFHSIGDWYEAGYAGSDGIHLTHKGYELKGSFLYSSIKNTLATLKECPDIQELTVPSKDYSALIAQQPAPEVHKGGVYKVKAGDTLSAIARKHKTTVKKLKELNHLKSDVIRIGQTIKY